MWFSNIVKQGEFDRGEGEYREWKRRSFIFFLPIQEVYWPK
jgi:hypothetical protein